MQRWSIFLLLCLCISSFSFFVFCIILSPILWIVRNDQSFFSAVETIIFLSCCLCYYVIGKSVNSTEVCRTWGPEWTLQTICLQLFFLLFSFTLQNFLFLLNKRNINILTLRIPSLVRKTSVLSCPYWSSSRRTPTL